MKRLFYAAAVALAALSKTAFALDIVYTNQYYNNPGIAYSTAPAAIDFSRTRIDYFSAMAVTSSATIPSVSWTDGSTSTNTLTVKSTATLKGAAGTGTITVATNSSLAAKAASMTINVISTTGLSGQSITLNGGVLSNPNYWGVGSSTTTTAANIATAINTYMGDMSATSSGSTVTLTAAYVGTLGNAYTVATSTPAAIVLSSSVFTGGQNAATFTINGLVRTANIDWTVGDVSSNTAVNIKNSINADGSFSPLVLASTSASTVVTMTCVSTGTACNSTTLVASTGLTAGGATFSGGQNPSYVIINGTQLTEGTDYTAVTTTSGCAKAISDAIMANNTLNAIIKSTWTSSVVSATSTAVGTNAYSVYAWPPAAFAWGSTVTFKAGTASAYSLSGNQVTSTNHGLTTALPVLYSTASAFALSGLTNQTTYYAAPIDANTFSLSLTSTGAVAGTYITLASTSTAGPHTFTVAPLAITGTASFKWQESNDNANWWDMNTSSFSLVTPYTSTTTFWDFGQINPRYVRIKFVAPTTGAVNLVITGYGKTSSRGN